jgi:hypothetical protein
MLARTNTIPLTPTKIMTTNEEDDFTFELIGPIISTLKEN